MSANAARDAALDISSVFRAGTADRLEGGAIVVLAVDGAVEGFVFVLSLRWFSIRTAIRVAAGLAESCEAALETSSSSTFASSTSPRVMRVNSDSMPASDEYASCKGRQGRV